MRRVIFFYGLFCYLCFFATFVYLLLFLTNLYAPKTIDNGQPGNIMAALSINCFLIALFGMQHSIMARKWFKNLITRYIPSPAERSTYVLMSCVALIVMYIAWQPLPGSMWLVQNTAMQWIIWGVFLLGCLIVFTSTLMLDHFELFGLKQVTYHLINKNHRHGPFRTPMLYKQVRHPIYFGFILLLWATPNMTMNHFLLSIGMTLYIVVGVYFEERDLVKRFGEKYQNYKKTVPGLIPFTKIKK